MVIFHSYVSLPEGNNGGEIAQQTEQTTVSRRQADLDSRRLDGFQSKHWKKKLRPSLPFCEAQTPRNHPKPLWKKSHAKCRSALLKHCRSSWIASALHRCWVRPWGSSPPRTTAPRTCPKALPSTWMWPSRIRPRMGPVWVGKNDLGRICGDEESRVVLKRYKL